MERTSQTRRLLALSAIYEGGSRTEAALVGGVTLQIVRDWVIRFNAEGPDGLIDRKAPGQPARLNDTHRAALAAIIKDGPTPAIHGVVRWRLLDLCRWLGEAFQLKISKQSLSRELRAMGYRKLSARPRHHAQAAGPELGTLEAPQATSLAGLAPVVRESGTWTGKRSIRGGRANLRQAIYMPALVATRFNPDFKAKYQGMIKA